MSAQLFKFPKGPAKPTSNESLSHIYYCLQCEGEKFRIAYTGEIFCSQCEAKIRNLAAGKP
jgi:DNA-directed RNA polymerase subunit RPC12/RpoP